MSRMQVMIIALELSVIVWFGVFLCGKWALEITAQPQVISSNK